MLVELELLEGCSCVVPLGGVLVEPAPEAPPMLPELEGALLDEDEEAPPLDWSFLLMSIEVEDELEPEGAGVVAEPPAEEDEDDEPGWVLAPDEGDFVVEDELDERSAPRSHAAISDAPSARETAIAMVESLIWPPWLGYWC